MFVNALAEGGGFMEGMRREPNVYSIDHVEYQAYQEPDLRWLKPYGTVFCVLDGHASGNLLFGVKGRYGKLFIKYAGAETIGSPALPADAIYTLAQAMHLYERDYPALTRLLAHGEAGDGYAAIFEWRDAWPLGYDGPDREMLDRIRRLPLHTTLTMLDGIFDLHARLALDGMIASGFHGGHALIDFGTYEAVICDISHYRQKPAYNDKGRLLGSSRFMAPEEYELNAVLDETTTAYNMAALAFAFFGSNDDRSRKAWAGPRPLFEAASRAVQEKKADRYPSMRAFLDAWRSAVGRCRI